MAQFNLTKVWGYTVLQIDMSPKFISTLMNTYYILVV